MVDWKATSVDFAFYRCIKAGRGGEGRKEEWKWYENELDVLIGKSEGRQIEKSIQPDVCEIPHQQQPEPDCTAYTEVCSVNN